MNGLHFVVAGVPVPQGSMRKGRRGQIIHSNPALEAWRHAVGWSAKAVVPRGWSKAGAFVVEGTFYFERPAYLPKTVTLPCVQKNDLDKLVRAIFDALKGIAYDDDGQVTDLNVRKRFGTPQVTISVDHVPM